MKFFTWVAALSLAAVAWAYSPAPYSKSAAETQLASAFDQAGSDSAKLKIAQEALDANPDNVAVGQMAQDVILHGMPDAVAFFKSRAEKSESIAAHFLYGRAADDSAIAATEATWILKKDPKNFWGHMLAADAEWGKSKTNYSLLHKHIDEAIQADPSNPNGYLYAGFAYEDQDKWTEARQAFEAGAIADPSNQSINDQRLTVYAQLHDSKAYFDLAKTTFSDKPLTVDLRRANATGNLTTADFLGKPTVVEFWAYT